MSDAPMAAKAPPGKRVLIDAIVLAFSKSELRDLVGSDALRMVLEGRYVDMVRVPGTLNLQPLWDLVLRQQGVTAETAIPPICRIKQWESRLQMTVEMPPELLALGTLQRDRAAQLCRVTEDELNHILAPPPAVPRPEASAPQRKALEKQRHVRLTAGLLGGIVAFLGLTIGGSMWFWMRGGPESIDPKKVTSELPVREVKKSADLVGVILSNRAAWLGKSPEDRRRVVAEALEHSRKLGAQRLVVMDEKGAPLAQATLGDDGKPLVTLQ